MRSAAYAVAHHRIPHPFYVTTGGVEATTRGTLVRRAKAQLLSALPHFHPCTIRAVREELLAGRINAVNPSACLLGTLAVNEWCVGLGECSGQQGQAFHHHCLDKAESVLGYRFCGDTYLEHYLFLGNKCILQPHDPVTRTLVRWLDEYLASSAVHPVLRRISDSAFNPKSASDFTESVKGGDAC